MRTPGAKRQQNGVTAGETALHFSSLRRTPGGDPLAHYRDKLQRLISAASRDGVILFVGPEQVAQAVRRPEAAA